MVEVSAEVVKTNPIVTQEDLVVEVQLKIPPNTTEHAMMVACGQCIVNAVCQNRVSLPDGTIVITREPILLLGRTHKENYSMEGLLGAVQVLNWMRQHDSPDI